MVLDRSAPGIFATTNRWGLPYWSMICYYLVGLLAFLSISSSAGIVFNGLVNMINMVAFFSWIIGSLGHLPTSVSAKLSRFRAWTGHRGHEFTLGRHDPCIIAAQDVDLTTGLDAVKAAPGEDQEPGTGRLAGDGVMFATG